MMENATRAMCSLYGLLGLIPGKVPMQRITQYYFDPSPKGGGVCSLISHIRVCEHEWSKPGECLEYGLACLQIQIILVVQEDMQLQTVFLRVSLL